MGASVAETFATLENAKSYFTGSSFAILAGKYDRTPHDHWKVCKSKFHADRFRYSPLYGVANDFTGTMEELMEGLPKNIIKPDEGQEGMLVGSLRNSRSIVYMTIVISIVSTSRSDIVLNRQLDYGSFISY